MIGKASGFLFTEQFLKNNLQGPTDLIPVFSDRTEGLRPVVGNKPPDILKKKGLRLLRLNDSGDIVKKRATRIVKALLFPCLTEWLARKTGANHIASINAFGNMFDPFRLTNFNIGRLSHLPDVVRKTPYTRNLIIMSHKETGG